MMMYILSLNGNSLSRNYYSYDNLKDDLQKGILI